MATTVSREAFKAPDGTDRIAYRHNIPSTETGPPIYVSIGASVVFTPGTNGKVQFTCSQRADVLSGNAKWVDWAKGLVTAAAADIVESFVTAVRGVASSGAATLEVQQGSEP